MEAKVRQRRPQAQTKKLQPPPLGKRMCWRATRKEGPSGKATAAVVSSGRMRPAARMREALT